jgi:hypothetical protein
MSRVVAVAHLLAPAMSEQITRRLAQTMEIRREPAEPTTGNVLFSIRDGRSVDGGWRETFYPAGAGGKLAIAAATFAGIGLVLGALTAARIGRGADRPARAPDG